MRRPRVRFTVRLMMAAVAIAGVAILGPIAMQRRRDRLRRLAAFHANAAFQHGDRAGYDRINADPRITRDEPSRSRSAAEARRHERLADHHDRLAFKYGRAARYPWLSVAPDPPEPR